MLDDSELGQATGGVTLPELRVAPRLRPLIVERRPALELLGSFELPEIRPLAPALGGDGTRSTSIGKVGGGPGGGGIGVRW